MKTLLVLKHTLKGICRMGCLGGVWLASGAHGTPTQATALLQCDVTYAGSTQRVEARPVSDPYPVPSVDIGGRFRFKAVMVGQARQVESIALYAYLETPRQPVLIHHALHLPPYGTSATAEVPYNLTGQQHLYAGPVERELIYHCMLQGVQP
jgi:hypothetical protein